MPIPTPQSSKTMQRILNTLQKNPPLSTAEIAKLAFVAKTTLEGGGYMKRLRELRLVHIAGWRKSHSGFTIPLYKTGESKDVPRPKFRDIDRDSAGLSRIVKALEIYGPMTYREAANKAGLSQATVKNARYMETLVKQQRIHVCAWLRNSPGPMLPLYEAGPGKNANKPKPYSRAEVSRRLRQRKAEARKAIARTSGLAGMLGLAVRSSHSTNPFQ